MKKRKIIILVTLGVVLLVSLIGYIVYDHFKYEVFLERDGIKYRIEQNTAIIVDGTNATKERYNFKSINNKPIVEIRDNAFKNNKIIKKVSTFYVEMVGSSAFENTSLEEFNSTLDGKNLVILSQAFKNCEALQLVKLNKAKLYPEAFLNCGSFDLTLKEDSSVESYQELITSPISPFRGSTLTNITLLDAKEKLLSYENGVLYSFRHHWWNNALNVEITSEIKPRTVLFVQESVKEISFADDEIIYMFAGIGDSLESIKVNTTNPYYNCVDGVLYSKDYTKLFYFPPKSKCDAFHENLKSIGYAAFSGNYNFKSLTLPKEITLSWITFAGVKDLKIDFNYNELGAYTIYDSQMTFSNAVLNSAVYNRLINR